MLKVYHGSTEVIKKPILELSKPHNDYGRGFYCTEDIELAKEWACKSNLNGIVNVYNLDISSLKVLYLNSEEYSVLNWIAILLNNRIFDVPNPTAKITKDYIIENYSIDLSSYDVIIGYRADDSYFSYAIDFINNSLSIQSLSKALKLGNLGYQTVLISENAFYKLEFVESINVEKYQYYKKYCNRDKQARADYLTLKNELVDLSSEKYILDIIRENKKYD